MKLSHPIRAAAAALSIAALGSALVPSATLHAQAPAAPAPPAVQLQPADTVRILLERQLRQVVTVKLSGGGDEITGTVTTVNDKMVHLARLTGRDFYDAFVPLEKISAVLVKARTN